MGVINLHREIVHFVNTMYSCPISMIMAWFNADKSHDPIPYEAFRSVLNDISNANEVYVDWRISMVYRNRYKPHELTPVQKEQQENVILAGWVLCQYGFGNLQCFFRTVYPGQFYFVTKNNMPGDIAVINPSNIGALQTAVPKWWKDGVPENIHDNTAHFALIPSSENWKGREEFMETIKKIGFHFYATVDQETKRVNIKRI
jgi:hypothetical protein